MFSNICQQCTQTWSCTGIRKAQARSRTDFANQKFVLLLVACFHRGLYRNTYMTLKSKILTWISVYASIILAINQMYLTHNKGEVCSSWLGGRNNKFIFGKRHGTETFLKETHAFLKGIVISNYDIYTLLHFCFEFCL